MSIWDEKPESVYKELLTYGYLYEERSMDAWLEKVKIIYEKTDKENCDLLYKMLAAQQKLEAVKKQVIEPQLKDSKEYLDTHTKPEPHDIEMSRYWLEKGIYGTASEINEILQSSTPKVKKSDCDTCKWCEAKAFRCLIGAGVDCEYEAKNE